MDEIDRLAARCVIVGIAGHTPKPEELELVRRGVGGVILFARNVDNPEQVATLARTLKEAAPGPLLICVDQEGGRVQRLRAPHWTELPSMRRVGQIDEAGGANGLAGATIAERLGMLVARELTASGFDLDFAPVVDVDTNPKNPVIADRSFSRDPKKVALLATAFARGLESGGIASCVKHFPGHGDTSQDSHQTLPRLAHDKSRLWEVELVPFVAAARAGLASVMTAHVRFDAFDRKPATLSQVAIELLRKDVEFKGCCISDDLEMKSIADTVGAVDGAELALSAGVDAVLVCHTLELQHDVIDGLARAALSGPLSRERLLEASAQVERLQKFAKSAASIDPGKARKACGTDEDRAFVASLLSQPSPLPATATRIKDPTEWHA